MRGNRGSVGSMPINKACKRHSKGEIPERATKCCRIVERIESQPSRVNSRKNSPRATSKQMPEEQSRAKVKGIPPR